MVSLRPGIRSFQFYLKIPVALFLTFFCSAVSLQSESNISMDFLITFIIPELEMSSGDAGKHAILLDGTATVVGENVGDLQEKLGVYMMDILTKAITERDGAKIAVSGLERFIS